MKRWSLMLVSALMVVAVLSVAGCQSQGKALVVGTSADYEPFEYVDENGKYVGFDIELMEEVAARLDMEIEWQDIAFDGLIFIGADAIIVAEGSGIGINKNDDMAGYVVGVQTGTIQEEWIDANIDAEVSRYERAEQAIMDLKSGRIDIVAMDYYAASSFMEQGGLELALKTEFAGEHMAIAVKEGNTELRDQIDAVVAELQAEGFVEDLAMKYLSGE